MPFQRFFGVFGYAVFCLALLLGILEGVSWLARAVHHHFRTSRSEANRASEDFKISAHVRGRSGRSNNPGLDEVWMERMGGVTEYGKWVDQMSASTAYDKSDWAEEFWTLERQRLVQWGYPYEPFRVWGMMRWKGKYVNNIQTEMGVLRRTVNAVNPACNHPPPTRIWMFGGSTIWGVGTPDSDTVPSQLERQINAAGKACVEVTNFGVEAYVTNQELIFLIQQLKSGHRPDVVVFYDGVNDAAVGGVERSPGRHNYFLPIKTAFDTGGSFLATLREKSNFLHVVRALRRRLAPTPPIASREDDFTAPAKGSVLIVCC